MRVSGIALLWLAALNALIASVVGTCSQGDASELGGIVITLISALAGLFLLRAEPGRSFATAAALAPPLAAFGWLTWWSFGLAWTVLSGGSACSWRTGQPGTYAMDGLEAVYGIAWPTVSVLALEGVGAAIWKRVRAET